MLVSVVVPTLNQGQFIEQTLASIAGQAWPSLELIVVDGASTDDTRAVVERYRHVVTHFLSEPDRGQAEAINKGFRLARGDILAWLNSDDLYLPCTLQRVARLLPDARQPRLVYGSCLAMDEGKAEARFLRAEPFDLERLKVCDYIYQPSAFWTRALWERTGELNEAYHYVLDWDWWLRAAGHGECVPAPECLSIYRFHPRQKTGSRDPRRVREVVEFVERHAGPEWGAAFRDVAAQLDTLPASLERLRRLRLLRLRRLLHRDLYGRHGARVHVALSQLHV